jgi:hypothetical protein
LVLASAVLFVSYRAATWQVNIQPMADEQHVLAGNERWRVPSIGEMKKPVQWKHRAWRSLGHVDVLRKLQPIQQLGPGVSPPPPPNSFAFRIQCLADEEGVNRCGEFSLIINDFDDDRLGRSHVEHQLSTGRYRIRVANGSQDLPLLLNESDGMSVVREVTTQGTTFDFQVNPAARNQDGTAVPSVVFTVSPPKPTN